MNAAPWRWLETRKWIVLLALVGLAARLILIALRQGSVTFYDERDYDFLARSLLEGRGFAGVHGVTAFRPPGQAVFMALVYAVAGPSPVAVHAVQALLLTLLPFAAARLGRLISGHPAVPIGAAALVALHPALTYSCTTLYPVTLTALLLASTVLASLNALEAGEPRWVLAAGSSVSLLALTTPYFVLMIPAVIGLLLLRRRWGACAAVAGIALVLVGGWMARNRAVIGAAALTTGGGYNLALGANDQATPRSGNWIEPPLASIPDDEAERDAAYGRLARDWIAANPVRWTGLALARAVFVLDSVGKPATRGAHDGLLARAAGWAMLPVTLLGLAGLWRERRRLASLLTAGALGCVVIASAATLVKPRFRFPCDPLLAPFAVAAGARRRRTEDRSVDTGS
ncbi:MAG TPA: glycosyltransferase family 39 protein [Myxococcaceae bacterium]|nr:glycosyltransferase family 39 protein [Myxococcaceae bacterium]